MIIITGSVFGLAKDPQVNCTADSRLVGTESVYAMAKGFATLDKCDAHIQLVIHVEII